MPIIFIILGVIILVLLVANIHVVQQSKAFVVERLGAYHTTWGVGLHVKLPLLDRVAKRVSLKELSGEHFIFHQTGQVASELCLAACREAGFEPNIVCRSASPTTGLYMVQGGLGVALLPSEEFGIRPLRGVAELKLTEKITKEVGIAWRKDVASPLVDAAARFAQEWVK